MAYAKDKNIIKFTGRTYEIVYNIADGSVKTNHPKGNVYIKQTVSRSPFDNCARYIKLATEYAENGCVLDGFMETIMLQADGLFRALTRRDYLTNNCCLQINNTIKNIKENWKTVRKLNLDGTESIEEINTLIFASKNDLNETELKWFKKLHNIPFVKHFAGQLEMYEGLIHQHQIGEIIDWYNNNQTDVAPFLVNKNLLQVCCELYRNMLANKDRLINEKIAKTVEKYKMLEMVDADGWKYELLKTREDFVQEAARMHNCLIRCAYDEKMADGRCAIMVVTTADGTRIDMEIVPCNDNQLTIRQMFLDYDKMVPDKMVAHIKKWADGLTK